MHTFTFVVIMILATLSHNRHLFKYNQIKTKSIQDVWNPKLLSNYSKKHFIIVACQYLTHHHRHRCHHCHHHHHYHRQKLFINSQIELQCIEVKYEKGKLTRYRTEAANSCLSTGITLWQIANRRTLLVTTQATGCDKKTTWWQQSAIKISEIKNKSL